MGLQRISSLLCVGFLGFQLMACSGTQGGTSSTNGTASIAEGSYCASVQTFGSLATATISGTAAFTRYQDYNGGVSDGLTAVQTFPIRRAEVVITDANGNTIQCGETDNAGNITMAIPRNAGNYTLKVNSRANNNYLKASILNNPTQNSYYSISSSFSLLSSDTTKFVPLAPAPRNGSLEGGAFNILDQLLKANEYLRANTACTGCTTFTVAPKINVYWTKGFNPGTYVGYSASNTTSFFLSGPASWRGLYINGGYNNSVCVDTDHFDNSVIVHEYGHFLEDIYSYSNNPGLQHTGNAIVDPRLAWSEGWADFIQAAVLGRDAYTDTYGNFECTGGTGVLFTNKSMENKNSDVPTRSGEGIFREFSITRTLYDIIQTSGAGDGFFANIPFSSIWKAFSDSTNGFRNSNVHFRNSGAFFQFLSLQGTIDANVIANEKQAIDSSYYATPITATGSCSNFSFAANQTVTVGDPDYFFLSNKYYSYYYDGNATNATVRLKYQGTGTYDLDLLAFPDQHQLDDVSTAVAAAQNPGPETTGAWPGLETISLSGKSPGYYLINVRADYSSNSNPVNFYLENGAGVKLCP